MIAAARRHRYTGPDRPQTDDDDLALAKALWKAVNAKRAPVEWYDIPVDKEMAYLVLTGRIEVEGAQEGEGAGYSTPRRNSYSGRS